MWKGEGNLQEYFILRFREVTFQVYLRISCAMSQSASSRSLNQIKYLCSWVTIIHSLGSNWTVLRLFAGSETDSWQSGSLSIWLHSVAVGSWWQHVYWSLSAFFYYSSICWALTMLLIPNENYPSNSLQRDTSESFASLNICVSQRGWNTTLEIYIRRPKDRKIVITIIFKRCRYLECQERSGKLLLFWVSFLLLQKYKSAHGKIG